MPVPTVIISPVGPIQKVTMDGPLVIDCIVTTVSGVEIISVSISWTGPEETMVTNDSRVTISPTTSSGNNIH